MNRIILTLLMANTILLLNINAQPWTEFTNVPTTQGLLSTHFLDDYNGFAVGVGGTILNTTDKGTSWNTQSVGGNDLYSTFFNDKKKGWAVGNNNTIWKTTNGGGNWTLIPVPPFVVADFRVVYFYNADLGFIAGGISNNSSTILRTTDGGFTWANVTLNATSQGQGIYGIFFTDENTGFATDYDGKILKTLDGGVTWAGQVYFAGNQLTSIYFTEAAIGYITTRDFNAGGNSGFIYQTTNFGGTWKIVHTEPNGFLSDIKFFNGVGFAVGGHPIANTGLILKSNISGTNWLAQTTIPANISLQYRVSLPCSHSGFCCGADGSILNVEGINDNCCADFMTDVMDHGIVGIGVSGNTYNFCLSPNISAADIVEWDLGSDGTIDATTNPCAAFILNPLNSELSATVFHVNGNDTCRVKVKICLPEIEAIEECSCEPAIFDPQAAAGFTSVKNSPFTMTFTPNNLLDSCDKVVWVFGDGSPNGNTTGNMSISHTFNNIDSFNVCMLVIRMDPNGTICERTICDSIGINGMVVTSDINQQRLSIKPNPANDYITITLPDNYNKKGNLLQLTSIEGKIVKSVSIESNEIHMDLEPLSSGMYFLQVLSKGRVATVEKVIKQ